MKPEEPTVANQEEVSQDPDLNTSPVVDGPEPAAEETESLSALKEAVMAAQEESKKNYDLYLRALAETENLRKRHQREREEYLKFASLPLIKQLLTVIDDLERALEMANPNQDYESLQKGISMICQRLKDIIAEAGVEPVEAVGQCFDPQYHQPLTVEECSDYPENTVIEELQKGYMMHGRLIRPSLVKVSGSQS
ncbi:MAG: nucleotide exchange factor GrpE [Syntrophomonadaceae bacterium]|nr:nucleotide exchange factor GrpE [Syntrophomonadaceae bacterium]